MVKASGGIEFWAGLLLGAWAGMGGGGWEVSNLLADAVAPSQSLPKGLGCHFKLKELQF